jgi:hypothetical protein
VTQPVPLPTQQDHDDWYPELADELPARPRMRLLTPLTVTLMMVLFAACGFIAGVLVEKHQATPSPTLVGTGAAGRFGAGATGASGAAGSGAGGRFASLFSGGAGSRGTVGTVTNVDGSKLYVTTAAGTMVEVVLTPSSKVTKSESAKAGSIHPGDSVVVSGITSSNGTVTASSVSDSGSSGGAGGLASLFGGAGGGGSTPTSSGGTSNGGVGSLFGG